MGPDGKRLFHMRAFHSVGATTEKAPAPCRCLNFCGRLLPEIPITTLISRTLENEPEAKCVPWKQTRQRQAGGNFALLHAGGRTVQHLALQNRREIPPIISPSRAPFLAEMYSRWDNDVACGRCMLWCSFLNEVQTPSVRQTFSSF